MYVLYIFHIFFAPLHATNNNSIYSKCTVDTYLQNELLLTCSLALFSSPLLFVCIYIRRIAHYNANTILRFVYFMLNFNDSMNCKFKKNMFALIRCSSLARICNDIIICARSFFMAKWYFFIFSLHKTRHGLSDGIRKPWNVNMKITVFIICCNMLQTDMLFLCIYRANKHYRCEPEWFLKCQNYKFLHSCGYLLLQNTCVNLAMVVEEFINFHTFDYFIGMRKWKNSFVFLFYSFFFSIFWI